eukprot:Sdes_comp19068_c0_seq2m9676
MLPSNEKQEGYSFGVDLGRQKGLQKGFDYSFGFGFEFGNYFGIFQGIFESFLFYLSENENFENREKLAEDLKRLIEKISRVETFEMKNFCEIDFAKLSSTLENSAQEEETKKVIYDEMKLRIHESELFVECKNHFEKISNEFETFPFEMLENFF